MTHSTSTHSETSERIAAAWRIALVLFLSCLLASSAYAKSKKPRLVVLATGGTIAGAQADTSKAGYQAGAFSIQDLLEGVTGLAEIADFKGEQVANIGSQDMNDGVWLALARRTNALLKSRDVDGVVITHGTDTLEETAYFLNLVVKSDKPVVLVGSMRPATAISADGPMNLYNGAALAGLEEARGRGVLVMMNDDVHYAAEITKTNTNHLNTMKSPNRGRAGVCNTGSCKLFSPTARRHTEKSEFKLPKDLEALPPVAIVYAHSNLGTLFVDAAAAAGMKGIVVAGVGNGNMTTPALEALTKLAAKGTVVVRSSRVGSGIVGRGIEVDDEARGFVASGELNPQKARILLQLALLQTSDPVEIQRMFEEY